MRQKLRNPAGDPIDAALMRASVRRKLFDIDEQVTIGRFLVERRLGAGGMGIVFQAVDPELGRKVALKLLHTTGEEAKLLAEARALARLRHPNVVAVHDVGSWQGRVFVTMEYVPGGTLRAWLRERQRPWREVIDVLARAARGLAAAHRAGLVHRDVKPENVLVGDDGEVRVVDFGLARPQAAPPSIGAPKIEVGVGTLPAGTPPYLAPEVKAGGAVDARSDQYSFCVTLHEALCGVRPAAGGPVAAGVRAPARIRRALARGLAVEPAARHPSMDALVTALERDPQRTLRRVALVALTAATAAALAWVVAARRPAVDPCGGAAQRIAGAWNPERRELVRRAFDASAAPYAAATRDAALAKLDEYAVSWARGHRESCQATHVRGEQSPATLDARTRCLERRRAALVATVDLLAGGQADAVEQGVRIVEALPRVDACADVLALSAPVPPPDDPAKQERLAALEQRLAEIEAMNAAMRLDQAREPGAKLVDDARALDYRPFLADALLAHGFTLARGGDKAALPVFREALAAAQASGHDAAVASASIMLVMIYSSRHFDKAHDWANLAAATLERLGRPAALVAQHEAAYALILFAQSEAKDGGKDGYVDAIAHLKVAVAQSEQAGQAGTLVHAGYLNDLGAVLDSGKQREEGLARVHEALAIYRRLVGDNHPLVVEALNNIATAEDLMGRLDDALAHFDQAHGAMLALGEGESKLAAMVLSNRAFLLKKLARLDDAVDSQRRSLAIREKVHQPDSEDLADAYLNMGAALSWVKKDEEALAHYQRSLPIYIKANGEKDFATGRAISNMGSAKLRLGRPAKALVDCEKGAAIMQEARGEDAPDLLATWSCIGEAHMALGRRDRAVAALERAIAIGARNEGTIDPKDLAETHEHLERARAMPRR